MKKTLVLLFITFFATAAYTQTIDNLKVTKSPLFKTEGDYFHAMLKDSLGNIYIFSGKHKDYEFQKADWVLNKHAPDLSLILTKKPTLEFSKNSRLFFINAQIIGKVPYLFFKGFDKKDNTERLYRVTVLEDGNLSAPEPFFSYKIERKEETTQQLIFSKDSSHFAVIFAVKRVNYSGKKFCYGVFDKSFKKISESIYENDGKEKIFYLLDYLVTNEGRFYAIASHDINRVNHYILFDFHQNNGSPTKVKLELEGEYTIYQDFVELNDGKLAILLSNLFIDGYKYFVSGIVFLKIDKESLKTEQRKMISFEDATYGFFKDNVAESANKRGVGLMKPRNAWLTQRENIVLQFEHSRTDQYRRPGQSNFFYDAGSMIIMKLDDEGSKLEEWVVPKDLGSTAGKTGLLTHLFEKNDKVFVLNNDVLENVNKQFESWVEIKPGSLQNLGSDKVSNKVVALCWVKEKDKKPFQKVLLGGDESFIYLNTDTYIDYSPKSIVVMGITQGNYLLGKLEF